MTHRSKIELAGWIFANLACIAGLSCTPAAPAATSHEVVVSVPTYVAVTPQRGADETEEIAVASSDVEPSDELQESVDEDAAEASETPVTFRRLLRRETTREHGIQARKILDSTRDQSYGHEVVFEVDGHSYMARIERHYHEPGGEARPWGWHRGISLFAVVPAS